MRHTMKLRRRCKCDCGKITSPGRKWISGHNSRVNHPMKGLNGKNNPVYKHGLSHNKLYKVWRNMKTRCYNSNIRNYNNYGGRGIRVCIRWRDNPIIFYNWAISHGYKEGLQIDRIDNDGNYHPDNCRFVSREINNNNQREIRKNNTSGYKGVSFNKASNKYMAKLCINSKSIYLGLFNTAEEAAQAIGEYKNS